MLKAHSLALFFACRDWPEYSEALVAAVDELREQLRLLLLCIRQTMLHNTPSGGSMQTYKAFDDLEICMCKINEIDPQFKNSGLYSRAQQYFSKMLETYERVRIVHDYRTPSSLRAYALVFLHVFYYAATS